MRNEGIFPDACMLGTTLIDMGFGLQGYASIRADLLDALFANHEAIRESYVLYFIATSFFMTIVGQQPAAVARSCRDHEGPFFSHSFKLLHDSLDRSLRDEIYSQQWTFQLHKHDSNSTTLQASLKYRLTIWTIETSLYIITSREMKGAKRKSGLSKQAAKTYVFLNSLSRFCSSSTQSCLVNFSDYVSFVLGCSHPWSCVSVFLQVSALNVSNVMLSVGNVAWDHQSNSMAGAPTGSMTPYRPFGTETGFSVAVVQFGMVDLYASSLEDPPTLVSFFKYNVDLTRHTYIKG
ncbi:hypothetical protein GOP47_0018991 [Adiantum capillus-veneris]|uniref:Uncharacterized protein n=1 Tax=Adiantum capillus-veneris TaxID=13818 RepID=A0A9D4ZA45_ADICA|nr:hypothetical protein GOP47_0018991 [Adiantum capillus-veneris]